MYMFAQAFACSALLFSLPRARHTRRYTATPASLFPTVSLWLARDIAALIQQRASSIGDILESRGPKQDAPIPARDNHHDIGGTHDLQQLEQARASSCLPIIVKVLCRGTTVELQDALCSHHLGTSSSLPAETYSCLACVFGKPSCCAWPAALCYS